LFAFCVLLQNLTIGSKTILSDGVLNFTRSSITSIGERMFGGILIGKIILSDNIPLNVSSIFKACITLKEVQINSNLNTIPDFVFMQCFSLESIILGDNILLENRTLHLEETNITSIGTDPFNSVNIASISFPLSLHNISQDAFLFSRLKQGIIYPSGPIYIFIFQELLLISL
jgi:hypothetical protein